MQLFNIANIVLGIVLFRALFVVDRQVRKRHEEWLVGLAPEHVAYLEQQSQDESERLGCFHGSSQSGSLLGGAHLAFVLHELRSQYSWPALDNRRLYGF